ncbi:MAG: hypothetical protein BGO39_20570 [Chloroflexi bacterium 54-19]|nr:MAG: hypothetical protein BGO39_20570 [Chloroflexi bacterium 54-19]
MISEYLTTFTRILLGILFAYSFTRKMTDVSSFAKSISGFGLFPKKFSMFLSIWVLVAELTITILFVVGNFILNLAFLLAIILLAVFSFALFLVIKQKKIVACNCFGANDKPVTSFDLVRNIGFILCALTGFFTATFKDNSTVV